MKVNGKIIGSNITSNVSGVSGMFSINNIRDYISSKQWPVGTFFDVNITGGNVTYGNDGFKYHQYDGSGGFNVLELPYPITLHILQIGGGGGGGASSPYPAGSTGAGGGAGQFLESNILISSTGSYAVLIGSGGNNTNGSNTSIVGLTANAIGGGRGGDGSSPLTGSPGASGGGGRQLTNGTAYPGGTGTAGFPGGSGGGNTPVGVYCAGGGGGASLPGQPGNALGGGSGGAGKQWVNGIWYAGGGGGCGRNVPLNTVLPGSQGYGGGGAATLPGEANKGGGGGGEGQGGSGVVIIRYRYR